MILDLFECVLLLFSGSLNADNSTVIGVVSKLLSLLLLLIFIPFNLFKINLIIFSFEL